MKSPFDLIVIGSGPAGLAAAAAASRRGTRCLILEQMGNCGRKLLASGGGKCNVTNILAPAEMAKRFGRGARFVRHALHSFSSEAVCDYFLSRGVPLELTDGFHYFPRSLKASDILRAMLDDIEDHGGVIKCGCRVKELLTADGAVAGVDAGGEKFYAPQVVIASGGRSYPALGGGNGGYRLAEGVGHRIVQPLPAMVGVQCREEWVKSCAGISFADAESRIALPGEKFRCRGELIFTHTGVSAFAILDISGRIAELLEQHDAVPLEINLFAGRTREDWLRMFAGWQRENGSQSVFKMLCGEMARKAASFILEDHAVKVAGFSAARRDELIEKLTSLKLNIVSTDGWEKAMVTRGGVELVDVDPRTMESRLVSGLYFAGEVLDVDGPCGGYNISWALASGFLAGKTVNVNA